MIFLIEYDRKPGKIITFKKYKDSERDKADADRLELELKLHRANISHEVVTLDAASEEDLRRTHARYFMTLTELVESLKFPKLPEPPE